MFDRGSDTDPVRLDPDSGKTHPDPWLCLKSRNLKYSCLSIKSCPILFSKLLYKLGQDFLDIQYLRYLSYIEENHRYILLPVFLFLVLDDKWISEKHLLYMYIQLWKCKLRFKLNWYSIVYNKNSVYTTFYTRNLVRFINNHIVYTREIKKESIRKIIE